MMATESGGSEGCVSILRRYPSLKDLSYLGGWKDPKTLLTCYQQPDAWRAPRAAASERFQRYVRDAFRRAMRRGPCLRSAELERGERQSPKALSLRVLRAGARAGAEVLLTF